MYDKYQEQSVKCICKLNNSKPEEKCIIIGKILTYP